MLIYILLALAWIITCFAIGWYISGAGLSTKKQARLGLILIGITYLSGAGILLLAVILF